MCQDGRRLHFSLLADMHCHWSSARGLPPQEAGDKAPPASTVTVRGVRGRREWAHAGAQAHDKQLQKMAQVAAVLFPWMEGCGRSTARLKCGIFARVGWPHLAAARPTTPETSSHATAHPPICFLPSMYAGNRALRYMHTAPFPTAKSARHAFGASLSGANKCQACRAPEPAQRQPFTANSTCGRRA